MCKAAVVWHLRRKYELPSASPDVGNEAEAFLRGTYAEYLEALGRRVPIWAWLNCLAHGTEADLSALAGGGHRWDETATASTGWHRMVSFLAAELLTTARTTDQTISALQRDVLVPLELDLAREDNRRRLRPAQLVNVALEALHGYPSTSE